MGFIKLVCPSCGENIELSDDRQFGFCSYCGTKIMQDKIVVEHKGSVSVRGIASADSLLDRAFMYIEDEKFEEASGYLERVLDISPRCAEAYMGKLMVQLEISDMSSLSELDKPLDTFEAYQKALRFATEEEKIKYEALNDKTKQKYESLKAKKEQEIDENAELLRRTDEEISETKSSAKKARAVKDLFVFLTVLLSVSVLILVISAIMFPPVFIAVVVVAALLVLCIIKLSRTAKTVREYYDLREKAVFLRHKDTVLRREHKCWEGNKGFITYESEKYLPYRKEENLEIFNDNKRVSDKRRYELKVNGQFCFALPYDGENASYKLVSGTWKLRIECGKKESKTRKVKIEPGERYIISFRSRLGKIKYTVNVI